MAAEYTPGGHRRFQFHDIERFAAEHGITLPGSTAQIVDVLVVDSDAQACTDLVEQLSTAACQNGRAIHVETATNCFEAGARALTFRPQYILLDLVMTGIETCSICNVMRSVSVGGNVQVLTLSADGVENGIECDVHCDAANDCMIKPVRNDALISALGLDNAPPLQAY